MKLWEAVVSLKKEINMVIYAESKEEALRLVENSKYDAVIDDLYEDIEVSGIRQLSSKATAKGWADSDTVFSYIDELTLGEVRERLEEAEKAAEAEAEFRRRQVEMFPNEHSTVQQNSN
jgi:hypothetical protein